MSGSMHKAAVQLPHLNETLLLPQFERDITIWNNKQYLPKPLLVREDSSIQKHRRWYAQFYSEKTMRLPVQKEGLDW